MLRDFINLIFPNYCITCNSSLYKQEKFICLQCKNELPELFYAANTTNPAAKLLTGRTSFNTCLPLYYYQKGGKVQKILKSMKYDNQTELCEFLGSLIGIKLKSFDSLNDIDLIIPVPLHPDREKIRGYNQSYYLGIGIASVLNIDVLEKAIIRKVNNATQTNKSRQDRWQNVNDIFTLSSTTSLINQHVLLVDDVITTGSTVESCCNVLNKVNGIKISIATLAGA
ncbi:MAG: ComF family protein [Flavobacteriales bacterium]|nr:ComF family protein [Flavobacteriales bacterium]